MRVEVVDAAKIRNTIDTDFSGVGTSFEYPYVPKGALWVDAHLKQEQDLFLSLADLEMRMRGSPFQEIRAKAKELFTKIGSRLPCVLKTEEAGALRVMYVDGREVRRTHDPYFLLGGHDLVYSYIPAGHIWIDTRSDPADWKYTLIHERDERERMRLGMSYDDAHDFALAAERQARREDGVADFIRG